MDNGMRKCLLFGEAKVQFFLITVIFFRILLLKRSKNPIHGEFITTSFFEPRNVFNRFRLWLNQTRIFFHETLFSFEKIPIFLNEIPFSFHENRV